MIHEITDELGSSKLKNHSVKDTDEKMRSQVTEWEKILTKDTSDK